MILQKYHFSLQYARFSAPDLNLMLFRLALGQRKIHSSMYVMAYSCNFYIFVMKENKYIR